MTVGRHPLARGTLLPREVRVPIPFPRLTFIDGEGRTPDWCFGVALIPEKFHDNLLVGNDIAGEKLTDVPIERTDLAAVQPSLLAVGPIDSPQARFRIEQAQ